HALMKLRNRAGRRGPLSHQQHLGFAAELLRLERFEPRCRSRLGVSTGLCARQLLFPFGLLRSASEPGLGQKRAGALERTLQISGAYPRGPVRDCRQATLRGLAISGQCATAVKWKEYEPSVP